MCSSVPELMGLYPGLFDVVANEQGHAIGFKFSEAFSEINPDQFKNLLFHSSGDFLDMSIGVGETNYPNSIYLSISLVSPFGKLTIAPSMTLSDRVICELYYLNIISQTIIDNKYVELDIKRAQRRYTIKNIIK